MNTPAALVAPAPRFILALLVAAVPLMSAADAARAQTGVNLSTDHVTVDLSVIGEMSGRMPPGAAATTTPKAGQPRVGGLLVPDARMPTSRLHVAAPPAPGGNRIKLRPPGSKRKKTAAAPRKPAPAKKPSPAKPAEKAAAAPPAPLTAPPKAPVVAAAPPAKIQPPAAAEPEQKPAPAAKTAAAKPAPATTEQASTPPAAEALKAGRAMQVAFAGGASKLPDASKDALTKLAKQLKDNETLRMQLQAYAGGSDLSASKARRLSLSRALSVRSFLIENGIRSTRIDVRALGDKTTEEPVNRVDVNIVER